MRLTAEVPANRFPRGLPRQDEMIVMVLAGKQTMPVRVLAAERTDAGDFRLDVEAAGIELYCSGARLAPGRHVLGYRRPGRKDEAPPRPDA